MSSDPEKPRPPGADPATPAAGPGEEPSDPAASGSIDVAVSSGQLPESSAASGSIDVAVSSEQGPASSGSIDVAVASVQLPAVAEDGTPVEVPDTVSSPVASGAVPAAVPREGTGRSSTRRLTEAAKDAVSGSVTALGTGIGVVGEGVSKLGEKTSKVPLVGSSVSALGESLTSVGESLTELPRVASTRRGRLLVRSLVVGFVLVFAWIVVIVALQLRSGTEQIDLRPFAEKVFIELSTGPDAIAQVYEKASPRFQEFVGKERFMDDMTDLFDTVGNFKEIAAVNETLVTRGPTGRVGRVSMTVAFEKGKTKASISLHQHEGVWKLLGIGVEVPPEVEITQREREARVQACKDPLDPKKCDLYIAANTILEQLRDNRAPEVWEAASPIFQKQEEKMRWAQLQREIQAQLGEYRRIIAVADQRVFRSGNAIYDILVEYARSQGVRVTFGFTRPSKTAPWKLISLKIVVPMPRADEGEPPRPLGESPTGNPPLSPEPPPTLTPDAAPPRPAKPARKPTSAGPQKGAGSAGSASRTGSASDGSAR